MEDAIMKKRYMRPQMEVLAINMCQMICASLPGGGNASDNNVTDADSPGYDIDWSGF